MLISIALCTYNGEHFLSEQLQSFINQTRLPDELVVCDDQSSDTTISILEDFGKHVDSPVRIIQNETNLGVTKNFEKAIAHCTGDIIVLSDQDDVWHATKLETFEKTFLQNPDIGLVFSDLMITDGKLNLQNTTMFDLLNLNNERKRMFRDGRGFELLLKQNYVTGAGMAFRGSYKNAVLPISNMWVHDEWIAIILSLLTKFTVIDEPLTYYRQHGNNQIGVTNIRGANINGSKGPLLNRIRKTLSVSSSAYLACAIRTFDFCDQIKNAEIIEKGDEYSQTLIQMYQKAKHFETRAKLPKNRVLRIPTIVSELKNNRYQMYSVNGIYSAVRDILVRCP